MERQFTMRVCEEFQLLRFRFIALEVICSSKVKEYIEAEVIELFISLNTINKKVRSWFNIFLHRDFLLTFYLFL